MKAQALVVAHDAHYLNWLENAGTEIAFSLARPLDAEALIAQIQAQGRVELVLVEFDAAEMEARAGMVERLLDQLPDVVVAAIGAEPHPDVVLAAMRAGARDFLVLRRDDATLAAALQRLMRRGAPAITAVGPGAAQGRLFTLMSSDPHEGLAFTAAHLALALVGRHGRAGERVLLLDIATPPGAASIYLNLAPGYSALDAVHDVYRCDQTLVETAFTRHASGLYVLSLPEDLLGYPVLDAEDWLRLVKVLRGVFTTVVCVIDGRAPLRLLGGLLTAATRGLWLTDQSILRSRHSKYLLRALRLQEGGLGDTALVVDAYQKKLGLESAHLAELLDLPLLATLGGDPALRIQAMNAGEPLDKLAPKDAFVAGIQALASALMSGERSIVTSPPAAGSWLGRLLGSP